MDKQTQAVAAAMQDVWNDFVTDTGCYPSNFLQIQQKKVTANFHNPEFGDRLATAALKASGAEYLGELVRALQEISKCRTKLYDSSKPSYEAELAIRALQSLPPELRGE